MSYFVYKYPSVGGDTYEVDKFVVSLQHVESIEDAKALEADGWFLSPAEAKAASEAKEKEVVTETKKGK